MIYTSKSQKKIKIYYNPSKQYLMNKNPSIILSIISTIILPNLLIPQIYIKKITLANKTL